jgi:hypothetical protein
MQLLRCSQVCTSLRKIIESNECDDNWRTCCREEFGLHEPSAPPRLGSQLQSTFRAAWLAWWREFSDFSGTPGDEVILHRAARAWAELRRWLRVNAPPVADSLAPGLSRDEYDALDPDGKLPVCARAIYRIHDGQLPECAPSVLDMHSPNVRGVWNGLFGGYIFYEHIINIRMLSLQEGILSGKRASRFLWTADTGSKERSADGVVAGPPEMPVIFSRSLQTRMNGPSKSYVLHSETGNLYVARQDRIMLCCTPPTLGVCVCVCARAKEQLIRHQAWMHECCAHAHMLCTHARMHARIHPIHILCLPTCLSVCPSLHPCVAPFVQTHTHNTTRTSYTPSVRRGALMDRGLCRQTCCQGHLRRCSTPQGCSLSLSLTHPLSLSPPIPPYFCALTHTHTHARTPTPLTHPH